MSNKKRVLFVYPNLQLMQITPPGVLTLASYVKSRGHDVELFDTTFYQLSPRSNDEERIDFCQVRPFRFEDSGITYIGDREKMLNDFEEKIKSFDPHIIAMSINDFTQRIGHMLLEGVKKKYPHIFVITGGVFTTFFPEYSISWEDVDAICIGEGWGPMIDACDRYGTDEMKSIANLWIKADGKIYKNAIRAPIPLNEIPPDDYTLFDEKRYFRPMQGKMIKMVPVWIDLGCPYQCTYCVAPKLFELYSDKGFKYFRIKQTEQIEKDINHAIEKINPSYFYFSTETFFARPKQHVEDVANLYKEKYGHPFWCETRIETVNERNIKILKDMNCDRVSIGLESGNEDYRVNVLKKTFTNDMFFERMKILNDYGVNVTINNIIGLPDETREMVFDTIMFNRKIQQTYTNIDITMAISTYVPCGGESLRDYALQKGYFDNDEYLKMPIGVGFHRGVFLNMPQLTPIQVKGLLRTFPMYVKMPEEYFPMIERAEQFDEEGDRIFAELREIFWEKYFKTFKFTDNRLREDPVSQNC